MLRLEAGGSRALVDEVGGGRLTSLCLGGVEMLAGTGNRAVPKAMRSGSFLMAPFAGRLPDCWLRFRGVVVPLAPTLQGFPAHGLVYDRPWSVVDDGTIGIDLDGRWPFGGRVEQRFDLTDGELTVTATLRNDECDMPGALGFHPWFVRRGASGTAVLNFSPKRRHRYAEARDLGPSNDLGARPWDDCFCAVGDGPELLWPGGGRLVVDSDASHWVVYEADPDALCLEPLSAPVGALASENPPLVTPGSPATVTMTIRYSAGADDHVRRAS